jgi:hypothetical protein
MDTLLKAIEISLTSTVSSVKGNDGESIKIIVAFPTERCSSHLIIHKKKNGKRFCFYIYVPANLTGSVGKYITFKNQYGVGRDFRDFITKLLKRIASTWNSYDDVKQWYHTSRDWKTKVEKAWAVQLRQLPVKRSRSAAGHHNMWVHKRPRKPSTIIVPLIRFLHKGEVPVISIRQAKKKDRSYLQMVLPMSIVGGDSVKRKSLQPTFGHDKGWSQFVKDELTLTVETWMNIDTARKWINEGGLDLFVLDTNLRWSRRVSN